MIYWESDFIKGKNKDFIMYIKEIIPTVFVKDENKRSLQLFKVLIKNQESPFESLLLIINTPQFAKEIKLENIIKGESQHDIFIDEIRAESKTNFILKDEKGKILDTKRITLFPVKHWTVHVVHHSHHDIGYTNIPSKIVREHYKFLDDAIGMIRDTMELPQEARMRIAIEQSYSLDYFLKNAPFDRVKKMIDLLQMGYIELTAFFGNMITEICGHESIIRSLYHSRAISKKYNIPVISAQHNDVPGMSWGMSRILADAGIKILCAGIPCYYNWGSKMTSTWNYEKLFGYDGPGAFWWETPSGEKILVWDSHNGYAGEGNGCFLNIGNKLNYLENIKYPYEIYRWPVLGARGDNSPYTEDYAFSIKEWNRKWKYPHLISSTNAIFYRELNKVITPNIPIFKGEFPGQDYPVGSISRSDLTALNRNNHTKLADAEKLAVQSSCITDYVYQNNDIADAYENILLYDEHSFGYHFPAGPAMTASEAEKAIYAYKANALAHDVTLKSMSKIADNIKYEDDGYYLVVFNTLAWQRSDIVHIPLRDLDCCGTTFKKIPVEGLQRKKEGLKIVILNTRWHIILPEEMLLGNFKLIDLTSKKEVKFQIIDIDNAYDTIEYSAQRLGLGSGGKRYGLFEKPLGIKKELVFIAKEVPSFGYKSYGLIPYKRKSLKSNKLNADADKNILDSKYYRIQLSPQTGNIDSIYDKELKYELIDVNSNYRLGEILVRNPLKNNIIRSQSCSKPVIKKGLVLTTLERKLSVYGHPIIVQTITIYENIKRIDFASRVLKDSTPLLDVHIAFPFNIFTPRFKYEGVLSTIEPIKDYLPGTYSDAIAVQNWVNIFNDEISLIWTSIDAPIVKFSDIWHDYVSQAHSCVMDKGKIHSALTLDDLNKSWIFSNIYNNNFGTNFSVSQVNDTLFRYTITSMKKSGENTTTFRAGWENISSLKSIFASPSPKAQLPFKDSFIEINNNNIILIACKKSENKKSDIILRLWNISNSIAKTQLKFNSLIIKNAIQTNIIETPYNGNTIKFWKNICSLQVSSNALINILITPY